MMMVLAWVFWALGAIGVGVYIHEVRKDYDNSCDN